MDRAYSGRLIRTAALAVLILALFLIAVYLVGAKPAMERDCDERAQEHGAASGDYQFPTTCRLPDGSTLER